MIDKLFDHIVVPTQVNYTTDPLYQKAMEDILLAEDILNGVLPEEAARSLTALTDAYSRLQDATARRAFKEGFCLGSALAAEVREHLQCSESNLRKT